MGRPTVCVTGAGAGVDNVWEQKKIEARKMLENAAESLASITPSHTSGGIPALEKPGGQSYITPFHPNIWYYGRSTFSKQGPKLRPGLCSQAKDRLLEKEGRQPGLYLDAT